MPGLFFRKEMDSPQEIEPADAQQFAVQRQSIADLLASPDTAHFEFELIRYPETARIPDLS